MAGYDYDLVTVGGGLGGAAGQVMAGAGARVLILRDLSEIVSAANSWRHGGLPKRGSRIADVLQGCGSTCPPPGLGRRDLQGTTPQGLPAIGFSHPEMGSLASSSG
jgi:hypothetical protein